MVFTKKKEKRLKFLRKKNVLSNKNIKFSIDNPKSKISKEQKELIVLGKEEFEKDKKQIRKLK